MSADEKARHEQLKTDHQEYLQRKRARSIMEAEEDLINV
jgi:hypothetical protein